MKNKILLSMLSIAFLWIFSNSINAQCIPDPNCSDPEGDGEYCPDTIPELMEGIYYFQAITFTPPPNANGINIHHLANVSVSLSVPGLNYSVYSNSFYPGQWYCLELYGTPAIGSAGIHNVNISFDVYISVFGLPINIGSFTDSSLSVTVYPLLTADFSVFGDDCLYDTIEISYTGSGTIAATYNWDLDSGMVVGGNYPDGTFQVLWTNPGLKDISLEVFENNYYMSDTFQIYLNPSPIVDLGADIFLSPGSSALIDAGSGFINYLWSNGDTNQVLNTSTTGIYTVIVEDINSCFASDTIEIFIGGNSQQINLSLGWNMFSTYIIPTYPSLDSIFSSTVSDIYIMKDDIGNIYWPSFGINNINVMYIGEGYQIKMINSILLNISGSVVIPETTAINLQTGWSMIGYLRNNPMPISQVFANINQNIIIVKDDVGGIYWPLYNLDNINSMEPGEGYLIKMSIPTILYYPPN